MKLIFLFCSLNLFAQTAGPPGAGWVNVAIDTNSATPTLNFAIPVLNEWTTATAYKTGRLVNSGSDKNWLFKVAVDHTSTLVPADFKAGKLLAISPPIITTGVQDGGQATLAGTTATVQAGTGYIAKYGLSPSAFPLITIVEWATQNITLPATGIHTLYISDTGVLSSSSGIAGLSALDDKISVGIIDMNLGKAYDSETYPTNPVGQLRGLALFFGGMTKGLKYTATGLQLARSAHDVHFWGANTTNPYSPNTKSSPALSPVTFFEFTQTGAVVPNTAKTSLRTDVYDLNGTLTTMGNNKWGFIRIFSSLGVDDYVMYSQAEYATELEAKTAAVATNFLKPLDLELTKFSSWIVFQKNDATLADNPITVCEPFGCDKVGTAAGGSGGGNVLGPATSVAGHLAIFADTTGKVLIDGGAPAVTTNAMNAKILELENRINALEAKGKK